MKSDITPQDGTQDAQEGIDVANALSRRSLLLKGSILGGSGLLSLGAVFSDVARANAANTSLTVQGDSITTDDGQLDSLLVSVSNGHLSYDGLDTAAVTVDINIFAAPAGGATDAARNRIASQTVSVDLQSGLDTNAGHHDYAFTDVDVLAADDIAKSDFTAAKDGSTKNTDVDFRGEVLVKDLGGNAITDAAATETVTVSVTNQAQTSGAEGTGAVSAGGTNQSP